MSEIRPSGHLAPTSQTLRDYTPARVALDRTGTSLTTRHALEFALAHAQARDAVHSTLDLPSLTAALDNRNLRQLTLHSAAPDRTTYLRRPDLGRTLSSESAAALVSSDRQPATNTQRPTLTIILADGLSATATNRHAIPLLDELLFLVHTEGPTPTWRLTPILIAQQARVALGDPIGHALHADATVMLIGERPGLSSPDSLGAYITWDPRPGRTDAERNCVSNIRSQAVELSDQTSSQVSGQVGLNYATAARKIAWYLSEGRRLGVTGVALRESDIALLP
jgi:ethanolamine ammonia-lyase small subunit